MPRRILLLPALAAALAVGPAPAQTPAETAAPAVPYRTELAPVGDSALREALTGSSNLLKLQDEPPPVASGLVRRAAADAEKLDTVLRSFGYYAGTVQITIAGQPYDDPQLIAKLEAQTSETPVTIRIDVAPGPLYTIGAIDLVNAEDPAAPLPVTIDRAALDFAVGDPARAAAVLNAEQRMVAQMRDQGHPFAAVPSRRAVVDHATQQMEVTYRLAPGPVAEFGQVTFNGLERVDESFVANRVPFEPGQRYSPDALQAMREDLTKLGLFNSVRVTTADALTPDGRLPVTVTVSERPRRFVGFGANYSTTEGLGLSGFWGHRNLFGGGESLRFDAAASRLIQNDPTNTEFYIIGSFRKPDWWVRDQDLVSSLSLVAERPEAYDREAVQASIGLERRFSNGLTLGGGLSFEKSNITEKSENVRGRSQEFTLIGVPLTARLDTSNDLLNPTGGVRLSAAVTPFPEFLGTTYGFTRGDLTGATYYDVAGDGRYVLAGRLRLGALVGQPRENIPADKRFYAGGGGSIRGYRYQSVGPRDVNNKPLGGLSVMDFSAELRLRITDTIGIVPFLDGGSAFNTNLPSFNQDIRFGAGIGARYYTGFGPIRVDVAFPLNPREDDDSFAIYVSLGQSF